MHTPYRIWYGTVPNPVRNDACAARGSLTASGTASVLHNADHAVYVSELFVIVMAYVLYRTKITREI